MAYIGFKTQKASESVWRCVQWYSQGRNRPLARSGLVPVDLSKLQLLENFTTFAPNHPSERDLEFLSTVAQERTAPATTVYPQYK
jgi:hypothetical protein